MAAMCETYSVRIADALADALALHIRTRVTAHSPVRRQLVQLPRA
ncbi:hypothetical protein K377_06576 [Streptomyces sp. PsTaAH-137]|nr:hypothetical protein K377_06576 [Streptomyces sp. PsTaAH-137]